MTQLPNKAPQFYTVAEVAELTRVSRMTVYRMVHSGELPAVRFGHRRPFGRAGRTDRPRSGRVTGPCYRYGAQGVSMFLNISRAQAH